MLTVILVDTAVDPARRAAPRRTGRGRRRRRPHRRRQTVTEISGTPTSAERAHDATRRAALNAGAAFTDLRTALAARTTDQLPNAGRAPIPKPCPPHPPTGRDRTADPTR